MAHKQNDYLAGLLKEVDDRPPAPVSTDRTPDRARGLTLLSRGTALDRVASGEVRQVTQLALDPARVRVWGGNARAYSRLSEDSCRDLIDSLIAEGGQKVPAIVRRVEGDDAYDYEVIAGTRRHWAIGWLRANSYPEMAFVAQIHVLDDEAAFRIADIENRARRDVSDVERARNYAAALATHYAGHQTRMAERLRVSRGWLSKMIRVAAVPDRVFAAFADIEAVSIAAVYPLAAMLEDKTVAKVVASQADIITREQSERRERGEAPYPAPEVVRRLRDAPTSLTRRNEPERYQAASRYGSAMLSIPTANRQGITLRLHAGSGASREEVLEAVGQALDWLDGQGRGLTR